MAVSVQPKGYQCEFIDSVPDDFYCKKCTLVARRLTFTSCCGESYCHACIADIQQQATPCPACGEKTFTLYKPLKYQRRMEKLNVYCSMRRRGCGWSGTLEQLDAHLDPDQDNCQHVDTKCPLNCQQAIPKNKVEQHMAEKCVKRDYVCQYCAFKATYEEVVDTHLPECIYFPLQCPNLCGVTCERDVMEDHMRMCRLEEVACEFSKVGCDGRFRREDHEEHTRQNNQKHLTLTATTAVKPNQQLQQKLQEQEQKLQEQEQKLQEQEQKLQEQEQKLQEYEQMLLKQDKKHEAEEQKWELKFQEQEKMLQEQNQKAKLLQEKSDKNEATLAEVINFVTQRTFAMENFSKEKAKDKPSDWNSPAMYTHLCGYKFYIGIDANGDVSAHRKAVTVYLRVVQGEYDHQLKWPAQASFTLELLNQQGGENIKRTLTKVLWEKPTLSYKFLHFVAFLEHSKVKDFLHNDALYFNITNITVF